MQTKCKLAPVASAQRAFRIFKLFPHVWGGVVATHLSLEHTSYAIFASKVTLHAVMVAGE
jgi:hypothetical protein